MNHADKLAIRVENVSKKYKLFPSNRARIREALDPWRRSFHHEFWALRDINFTVSRGHTVGILGMNGSGKSTLLQIIASVLQPTAGTVHVTGRVAALLELGAGFNPDFTARENVVLNGTIMGLSRSEILDRMSSIEAFADIGEFFDQPMKTHSSGMFMRVAFATAIYVDPEVLIIDEALSVGDTKFQEKCFRRFRAFQDAGKTILFVTHDRSAVPRYCDVGLVLHQGQLVDMGDPGDMADLYGEVLTVGGLTPHRPRQSGLRPVVDRPAHNAVPGDPVGDRPRAPTSLTSPISVEHNEILRQFLERAIPADQCPLNPTYNKYEQRFGNGHAEILDYLMIEADLANPTTIAVGADVDFYFKVLFHRDVEDPIIGITFTNREGVTVYAVNTGWMKETLIPARAGDVRVYRYRVRLNLGMGDWFLEPGMAETTTDICDCRTALAHFYLIDRPYYGGLAKLDVQFSEVSIDTQGSSGDPHPISP